MLKNRRKRKFSEGGLLLSDRIAAEKAAAEKAAAERWDLSEREKEIVRMLGTAEE